MDLRGVASHVHGSIQISRSPLVPTPSAASTASLAFLAAFAAPWLPDAVVPAIMTAACTRTSPRVLQSAPGRERIRDIIEDAHIPGICPGETADEEALTADLQRNTMRQGCADCKPLSVIYHVVDCPTPKDHARGEATA